MFKDEVEITDPCLPYLDQIGVQDWTLIGGCPEYEGWFTGDLREAMERYDQSKMFEAQLMIDNAVNIALFGEGEADSDLQPRFPCHLIADNCLDFVFTFPNGFLEVHEGDELIIRMPASKMDHFSQSSAD